MSVAAIIHAPCPDMPHYSLNKEQKAKGLQNIAKVKQALREKQLAPLRAQRSDLAQQARECEDARLKAHIAKQIKDLDAKGERIAARWS